MIVYYTSIDEVKSFANPMVVRKLVPEKNAWDTNVDPIYFATREEAWQYITPKQAAGESGWRVAYLFDRLTHHKHCNCAGPCPKNYKDVDKKSMKLSVYYF
jgi:hypothetical protein